MKKAIIILLASLGIISGAKAQDQLFKRDNSRIQVKIVEVGTDKIKYKLYNNLNGPVYSENKSDVLLIIYESGVHEVISSSEPVVQNTDDNGYYRGRPAMSRSDSMILFKYSNSLGVNFLNFFNSELGFTYQADFFKSNFNIIVPFAFGVANPNITQNTYFNNSYNGASLLIDKKNFEVGFGINYYPNLKTSVNYFIGPAFKFMQYSATGKLTYQVPGQQYYVVQTLTKGATLNRYTMSITNGVVFRTRSRLNATCFASMGFKNDVTDDKITNPNTNVSYNLVNNPLSFYFWCGFNVGFCF